MNAIAKILIADDHKLFLDGLNMLLRNQPNFIIEGMAYNGAEVLESLKSNQYDMVITDLNMPGMGGVELVKSIKEQFPQVKLLVITMNDDREIVTEILLAEAEGYLLKNSGKEQLLTAINNILGGKTHYEPEVINLMLDRVRKTTQTNNFNAQLSTREKEVLDLIMQEFTSKEIAEQLFISKQTVDTHRINIMQKTGAKTLVGLLKMVVQQEGHS